MGVTIHFEGTVADTGAIDRVIKVALSVAGDRGWRTDEIELERGQLTRVVNDEDIEYEGWVRGIVAFPHEDCDPVRLEFGADLRAQDFVKTQFAGGRVHEQVVDLLRAVQPHFGTFVVEDEGEFWESSDSQILEKHIQNTNRVLEDYLATHPGAKAKVKVSDGRILDILA